MANLPKTVYLTDTYDMVYENLDDIECETEVGVYELKDFGEIEMNYKFVSKKKTTTTNKKTATRGKK